MKTRSKRNADGASASFRFRPRGGACFLRSLYRFEDAPEEAEDQDTGDLPTGVDEDALNGDELDTDQITRPPDLLAPQRRRRRCRSFGTFRIPGVHGRTGPIANANP